MSQTFHCPRCGAPLDPPSGNELSMRCPFCSSSVIVPEDLRRKPPGRDTLSRAQVMTELPESTRDMMEIIRLTKAGRDEEAIQRFREVFDTSRGEAAATIEAIKRNQVVQLTHSQTFAADHTGSLSPNAITPPATGIHETSSRKTGSSRMIKSACVGVAILAVILGIAVLVATLLMTQPGGPLYEWWQEIAGPGKTPLLLSFGEEGTMPGQFSDPDNIAVDSAGNIFVADRTTGRIQHFDPQGNFVRLWDAGDGKVVIRALEVDQDGILYAAARTILRYDTKTGEELEPIPNPNGYYFFDFKVLSGGGFGALVDGQTLVRLNPDGSPVWMVEDAISSVADETDTGGSLAVDGNNNFYLAGRFVESVFKYSPDGKYLNRWGSEGDGEGQFDWILAIAIDDQGRVVVCEAGELEVFESDGRFVEQIDIPETAFDLQYDLQGNLYTVTHQPGVNVYNFK
ncbi:MAG: hypothetical protein MUO76_12210 [Anaerolineaceae bacterium]|nr:hypothetical protein [Anaerolineaceae bacterium]